MAQFGFDRLILALEQFAARARRREDMLRAWCRSASSADGSRPASAKLLLTVTIVFAVADQQTFDRGIGEAAHAVGLELRAPLIAHIESDAAEREQDDDEARERDRNGEPAGGQGRFRNNDASDRE